MTDEVCNGEKIKRITRLEDVIFDDPVTGEKGMVSKLDELHTMAKEDRGKLNEMYTIFNQAKGIPWFFKIVVGLGAFLAAVKLIFFSNSQ